MRYVSTVLLLGLGLLLSAQAVLAQTSLDFDTDSPYLLNACLQDVYADDPLSANNSLNCTANDTRVGDATVINIIDGCTGAGDTATLEIAWEIIIGATTRYDVGVTLRQDGGGSAEDLAGATGMCYFWAFDPTKDDEGANADQCAELFSAESPYLSESSVVTIDCVDRGSPDPVTGEPTAVEDGIADLSVCLQYANNSGQYDCDPSAGGAGGSDLYPDVPVPGTASKCKCDDLLQTTPPLDFNVCDPLPSLPSWDGTFVDIDGSGVGHMIIDFPAGADGIELKFSPDGISKNIAIQDVEQCLDPPTCSSWQTLLSPTGDWTCSDPISGGPPTGGFTSCTDGNIGDGSPTGQIRVKLKQPANAPSSYDIALIDDCNQTGRFDPPVQFFAAQPTAFVLDQNYPNPFNPSTRIGFLLPDAAQLSLTIYDVTGRKVRTLASGGFESGRHEMVWNGTNDSGFQVPSGVYIYRLEVDGTVQQSRRLTLMR